jgi:hypothetical protein
MTTRQAMYAQRNIETRSRNDCCRGKAISITDFPVFVRARACSLTYPARKMRVPYIVIRSLSHSANVFDIISQTVCVGGGGRERERQSYWTQNVCFDFLYSFHLKKLIIRIKIRRDIALKSKTSSCKSTSPFQILMKLELSRQIFEKVPNTKFNRNPSSVSRAVLCKRADMTISQFWERA